MSDTQPLHNRHIKIESHGPGWQGKITDAETGEMLEMVARVVIDIQPTMGMAEATLMIYQNTDSSGRFCEEKAIFNLVSMDITAEAQYWHSRLGELQKLRFLVHMAKEVFAELSEIYAAGDMWETSPAAGKIHHWLRKLAEIEQGKRGSDRQ